MSKVRDISNLSNVIRTDASGNVSFVSGSTTLATLNTSGQLSGSSPVLSSSYALNATSASYATNATNAVTASFANAFTVANTLTAQTLVVQTVTSSVIYSSGSNVFGNNIANTQVFTGSVYMNPGGLFVSGSGNVGIGTTTPSASLNIEKSTNSGDYGVFPMAIINNSLATQGDGSTSYNFAAIYTNSGNGVVKMSMQSSYAAGTWEPQGILNVATNHPMVLKTNNTERMRISSTGITTITGNGGSLVQKASTANADLYFEMLNSAGTRRSYMGFGGASSSLFEISNNENGAIDFRTNAAFAMRITSGGNVGIGTSSPLSKLNVETSTATDGIYLSRSTSNKQAILLAADDGVGAYIAGNTKPDGTAAQSDGSGRLILQGGSTEGFQFQTSYVTGGSAQSWTTRMRITSTGLIIKATDNTTTGQIQFGGQTGSPPNAILVGAADQNGPYPIGVKALYSSQGLIGFFDSANGSQGSISISGATVSYNSFMGSHWSQLHDNSKPEILKGTVLEAIDEFCEWDGKADDRLPKVKISNTVESKNVYGVFFDWDNADDYNDMYVAALGAGAIRVNSSATVSMGDLLQSNGDGTAKVQSDDIMHSSTIAKVVSTQKIETYEDGSYLIAATLHCG